MLNVSIESAHNLAEKSFSILGLVPLTLTTYDLLLSVLIAGLIRLEIQEQNWRYHILFWKSVCID